MKSKLHPKIYADWCHKWRALCIDYVINMAKDEHRKFKDIEESYCAYDKSVAELIDMVPVHETQILESNGEWENRSNNPQHLRPGLLSSLRFRLDPSWKNPVMPNSVESDSCCKCRMECHCCQKTIERKE